MHEDKQKKAAAKRREFLKLAGLGAASGAAAATIGARVTQAAEQPERPHGYRETAHVKKFYELARF